MNDVATLDRPNTELALVGVRAITAADVFKPGGVDDVLKTIREQAAAFAGDVTTPQGREEIASFAYRIARSKTALDKMGKELTEQWRIRTNAVNADRRRIVDELDTLKDQVRAPLNAYEKAEEDRVAGHNAALAAISEQPGYGATETVAEIELRLNKLLEPDTRDWQEFATRAEAVRASEIERTRRLLEAAQKREAEAAELARFRAEEAERQRQAEIEARRQREAELARKAAEAARVEAEQKAARDRQEYERQVERERQAAADREAAAARAAEERRQDLERQAEQERREAVERQAAAERRAEQAERDRKEAEARYEAQRIADAQEALAARRQAVLDEQQRVADERAREHQEELRRAANKDHKAKINRAAKEAMLGISPTVTDEIAMLVVAAIARGEIPRVTISY